MPIVSSTRASTYLSCPRKYKHLYVDNREPRDTDANLTFGTAWHSLMEARWKGQHPVVESNPLAGIRAHEKAVLESALDVYRSIWDQDDTDVRAIEVEAEHEILMGTDILSCRLDGVIEKDGDVYVVEHKTTSSDLSEGSVYWERLTLDQQVSWYLLAARTLGYKPVGVLYDVFRKPSCRRTKSESSEQYTDRCIVQLRDNPGNHFAREIVTRTERELDRARENFHDIASMVLYGKYPQNPRACMDWGRRCEFWDVCTGETTIDDDRLFQVKVPR